MAIFYCQMKIIGRSSGRSSVGASAYRSGEKIKNDFDGIIHDYRKKTGVVFSEILLPKNAPLRFENRSTLWNEVEQIEKGKNAQLSREIVLALPVELNRDEQIKLTQDYVKNNFVNDGMIADVNIHDKEDGNPHAHIMLTVRSMDEHGEWQAKQKKEYILDKDGNKQYDKYKKTYKCRTIKTTNWDDKEKLLEWRENWANEVNQVFQNKGMVERIDHRSYKEQGSEKIPQIHMGHEATAMEKRGIETYKGNINRKIVEQNLELEKLNAMGKKACKEANELMKQNDKLVKSPKQQPIEVAQERKEATEPSRAVQERREAPEPPRMVQERREAPEPPRVAQERKPLTAEERANRIKEKQNIYLSIEREQKKSEENKQVYLRDKNTFPKLSKKLIKDYENIQKIADEHGKVNDKIQGLRESATLFHNNKKEISFLENQKQDLSNSYHKAKEQFKKYWEIEPKKKEVEKTNQQIHYAEEKIEILLPKEEQNIMRYEEQKQNALLEYKTEIFIAETLPNREEIFEKLEKSKAQKNEDIGEKKSIVGKLDKYKNIVEKREYKNTLINDIDRKKVIEYQKKINPNLAKRLEEYFEKASIQKQEEKQIKRPPQDRGFER